MKKRSFLFLSAGLIVLLVILAILPAIFSTGMMKHQAVGLINKRIDGRLNLERWSLGWFSGIRCEGIDFLSGDEKVAVQVERISLSKGLMPLIFNRHRLGRIEIVNPHIALRLPEAGDGPGAQKKTSSEVRAASSGAVGKPGEGKTAPLVLPAVTLDLKVTGGKVGVGYAAKNEALLVQDLRLDVQIDEPEKLISYRLLARDGQGKGRISGQGIIALPPKGGIAADRVRSDAELVIADWEMAPGLAVASALAGSPTGEGRLNGQLEVRGDMASGIRLTGQITGTDVRLSGRGLKGDTPFIKKITGEIDAVRTGSELEIHRLVFDSSVASGNVSGRLSDPGESRFQTEAIVNLAELFNQLPNTLNLRPDTKITDGLATLKATVESDGPTTRFDGHLQLDRLAGISGKKRLAWSEPLVASVTGAYGDAGIHLDDFKIRSSFFSGEGRGAPDNLNIRLEADIQKALGEAGKFFDTQGWKAAGRMKLSLQSGIRTANERFVEADLEIEGLGLSQRKRKVVPESRLVAALKTDLVSDKNARLVGVAQTSIDFNTWLGKGRVGINRLEWPGGDGLPRIDGLNYDGTLALRSLSRLLHGFDLVPGDTDIAGLAEVRARLSSDEETAFVEDIAININGFVLRQEKRRLADENIRVKGAGRLNLKNRSVVLKPLTIKTSAARMDFPELAINNWDDFLHTVTGAGSAQLDLAALVKSLEDYLDLPEKTTISGKATIEVKADGIDTNSRALDLNGIVAPLKVAVGEGLLIDEKQLTLGVNLTANPAKGDLSFEKISLATRPLSINAAGQLVSRKKTQVLTAKGDLIVDLNRLQAPLNAFLGTDIAISGKSDRPFTVRIETPGGKWGDGYRHLDLDAAVHAERISGFGLEFRSLEVPLKIDKSLARADITGTVNDGQIALRPMVDLAAKPLVLSLPKESKVLTGTRLTKEMANELLALIHPVFKGAVATKGTVDMVLNQMAWPLDASARNNARFEGILRFTDVHLDARGLIYELLAAMRVEERNVVLDERVIEFSGKDGRVQCSPLRISVKGYQMEVGGTMGFDGSLDYTAKIPITEEIAGKKAYPYLEETTLDIPIGGTVSHPKLDLSALETMVEELMIEAGSRVLEEKAGDLLKKLFK